MSKEIKERADKFLKRCHRERIIKCANLNLHGIIIDFAQQEVTRALEEQRVEIENTLVKIESEFVNEEEELETTLFEDAYSSGYLDALTVIKAGILEALKEQK